MSVDNGRGVPLENIFAEAAIGQIDPRGPAQRVVGIGSGVSARLDQVRISPTITGPKFSHTDGGCNLRRFFAYEQFATTHHSGR